MTKIIAIGGGQVSAKSTLSIDKEIIAFSGKKNPKLLFIPTASSDSETYYNTIKEYFESMNCKVDVLYLLNKDLSFGDMESKILGADIIYVGGGNTLKMMTLWRKFGIDTMLEKARNMNIVLCGLSAGSICWFSYGNSDSRKFTSGSNNLIKVSGLSFVNALHCPHYDSETHRQEDLKRMMKNMKGVAIALEDNCAIQIHNENFRIISSQLDSKAYKIYRKKGEYYKEIILQNDKFTPLDELLKK